MHALASKDLSSHVMVRGPWGHLYPGKAEEPLAERVSLWWGKLGRVPRRSTGSRTPQVLSTAWARPTCCSAGPPSQLTGGLEARAAVGMWWPTSHPGTNAERWPEVTAWVGGPPTFIHTSCGVQFRLGRVEKWKHTTYRMQWSKHSHKTYGKGLQMRQRFECTM